MNKLILIVIFMLLSLFSQEIMYSGDTNKQNKNQPSKEESNPKLMIKNFIHKLVYNFRRDRELAKKIHQIPPEQLMELTKEYIKYDILTEKNDKEYKELMDKLRENPTEKLFKLCKEKEKKNEEKERLRDIVYSILGGAGLNSNNNKDRIKLVEELTTLALKDPIEYQKRSIFKHFLWHFNKDDFNDKAKENIKKIFKAGPLREVILMIGLLDMKELKEDLKKMVPDNYSYNKNIKNTLAWTSLIALARMGDEKAIKKCFEIAEEINDIDVMVMDFIWDLTYTRHPKVIPILVNILNSKEITPYLGEDVVRMPYALRAFGPMAQVIKNFPFEEKKAYLIENIGKAREWVKKQEKLEIKPEEENEKAANDNSTITLLSFSNDKNLGKRLIKHINNKEYIAALKIIPKEKIDELLKPVRMIGGDGKGHYYPSLVELLLRVIARQGDDLWAKIFNDSDIDKKLKEKIYSFIQENKKNEEDKIP